MTTNGDDKAIELKIIIQRYKENTRQWQQKYFPLLELPLNYRTTTLQIRHFCISTVIFYIIFILNTSVAAET